MTLIRWQPWHEMETLRRQMDRLFDDLAPATHDVLSTGHKGNWTPAIEVKATDTDVIVRAELPGIEGKDLDIQVTREAISLAGEYKSETQTETGRVIRSEFRYGSFHRVIPMPVAIQHDQVKAEFTNGVLTLTLPKLQAERPKVVKVNLTGATTEPDLESAPNHGTNGDTPIATAQPETGDVWAEATQN